MLTSEQTYHNLMRYARVLLEHCSEQATQLFIVYYTGRYRPKVDVVLPEAPTQHGGASGAMQNLAAFIPLPYMSASSNQTPSTPGNQQNITKQMQLPENANDANSPIYKVPKPRTAFSAFVDHPGEFITFLEACLREESLEEGDRIDLYTTLFEMYLSSAKGKKGDEKGEWERKAKGLVENNNVSI